MNLMKMLQAANVPDHQIKSAYACLSQAEKDSKGLFWAKWKTRLFYNKKIAKILSWDDNRLCIKRPDLAHMDIAPMLNITANGDNVAWPDNIPDENSWMEPDPKSYEYEAAIKRCYWSKGNHPRSPKARQDWYRRNAGEMVAYQRGLEVPITAPEIFVGNGFIVRRLGDAWQLEGNVRLLGFIPMRARIGYEITNIITDQGMQSWYPIPGYKFVAPLTWSVLPR